MTRNRRVSDFECALAKEARKGVSDIEHKSRYRGLTANEFVSLVIEDARRAREKGGRRKAVKKEEARHLLRAK